MRRTQDKWVPTIAPRILCFSNFSSTVLAEKHYGDPIAQNAHKSEHPLPDFMLQIANAEEQTDSTRKLL